MKRKGYLQDHQTKRLVLGVEKLSLGGSTPTPSPSPTVSVEGFKRAISDEYSEHSEASRQSSSSSDSDSDRERSPRARALSDTKTQEHTMDIVKRDRTWSCPRVAQLQQEEARASELVLLGAVLSRLHRPRLRRRASDPPRILKGSLEKREGGYTAGCECDSDGEDGCYCKHCKRKTSDMSL